MQLQENSHSLKKATSNMPAPSQPCSCPAGALGVSRGPTCICLSAASLLLACSNKKASDIVYKDILKASHSPAFHRRLGAKQAISCSQCLSKGEPPGSSGIHHGHGQTRVSRLLSCCLTGNKAAAVHNRSPALPSSHSQFAASSSLAPSCAALSCSSEPSRNELLGWLQRGQ